MWAVLVSTETQYCSQFEFAAPLFSLLSASCILDVKCGLASDTRRLPAAASAASDVISGCESHVTDDRPHSVSGHFATQALICNSFGPASVYASMLLSPKALGPTVEGDVCVTALFGNEDHCECNLIMSYPVVPCKDYFSHYF